MANEKFDRKLVRYFKFIPPYYKPGQNVFVTALLKALATTDSDVEVQIEEAGNQIFVNRAEGKFLDTLGNNVGVDRPIAINLSDDKFRELVPTLSFKPKQVRETMYDILDVFWGPLYSRSNLTGEAAEPYDLGPVLGLSGTVIFENGNFTVSGIGTFFTSELQVGDYVKAQIHENIFFVRVSRIVSDTVLRIDAAYQGGSRGSSTSGIGTFYTPLSISGIIDGGPEQKFFITPNNIVDTTNVTAAEVADAINAQITTSSSQTITASVLEDFVQSLKFVNLRTDTPGTTGSLKITGGTANIFAFGVQNSVANDMFVTNQEGILFTNGEDVKVGSSTQDEILTNIVNIAPDDPVSGITKITLANQYIYNLTR